MDFGLSFAPGQQQDQQRPGGSSETPIQDAIKLLSLRIPNFRGAGGVAALPLLQGAGSRGVMGQAPGGLQQLLQQLFATQSAPTPNVIPIGGQEQGPILEAPQAPQGQMESPQPLPELPPMGGYPGGGYPGGTDFPFRMRR